MSDQTELGNELRVRTLEAEVLALQQRLGQREELLKVLNRRLLQLERGESGDSQALKHENSNLHQELDRLRSTKLFRWSSPARDVYSRLRRPR